MSDINLNQFVIIIVLNKIYAIITLDEYIILDKQKLQNAERRINMDSEPFCTCTNLTCKLHPNNHSKGCDPCIQKNLKLRELPNCMFKLINEDISEVKDSTVEGFVDFYKKK